MGENSALRKLAAQAYLAHTSYHNSICHLFLHASDIPVQHSFCSSLIFVFQVQHSFLLKIDIRYNFNPTFVLLNVTFVNFIQTPDVRIFLFDIRFPSSTFHNGHENLKSYPRIMALNRHRIWGREKEDWLDFVLDRHTSV